MCLKVLIEDILELIILMFLFIAWCDGLFFKVFTAWNIFNKLMSWGSCSKWSLITRLLFFKHSLLDLSSYLMLQFIMLWQDMLRIITEYLRINRMISIEYVCCMILFCWLKRRLNWEETFEVFISGCLIDYFLIFLTDDIKLIFALSTIVRYKLSLQIFWQKIDAYLLGTLCPFLLRQCFLIKNCLCLWKDSRNHLNWFMLLLIRHIFKCFIKENSLFAHFTI